MEDSNGYVTRPELERTLDRLELRLKIHITDAKADAKEADDKIHEALEKIDAKASAAQTTINRWGWALGGGSGVVTIIWFIYKMAADAWAVFSRIS